MFPFAHIGYSLFLMEFVFIVYYLILKISNKQTNGPIWGIKYISLIALIIGSLGPDIIDKAISLPITGNGRYIAHSLFFDLLISSFFIAVFWKKRRIWIGLVAGWQLHLILDTTGFIPWFFPFISYEFPERSMTYIEILLLPSTYVNELVGVLLIIGFIILYSKRGYSIFKLLKEDLSKESSFLNTSEVDGKNI